MVLIYGGCTTPENITQFGESEDFLPAIELQQIILPAGHPEFPLDTVWVVVPAEPAYFEVPIPVTIPEHWAGKYLIDQQGNTVDYLYIVAPDRQERLFSISALTETEWQAIQNEPHGEVLMSYGGIVWVYNLALENPLNGAQADEFSGMVGEAYDIAHSLAAYFTPVIDSGTLLPYLQTYFDVLATGNYAEAARIFSGDIQPLADMNPDISPGNRALLFERACTTNGFLCNLKIGGVIAAEEVSATAMQFILTLQNPDGTPFELGPCCGSDSKTSPPQTEFVFTVELREGIFQILEMPIFAP